MRGALKLGRVAGIGVFVHWTFTLLILYIIYTNYRAGHSASQIIWSVLFVLSIFVTVFLHELGHALAAKRYNIKTTDITLLPIGGLARLESIPEKPKEELVVALAGPAVNVILATITGLIIKFPDAENVSESLVGGVNGANFFFNFFIVNLWLAVFNLIPAFPMDGGRVLRAVLAMKFQRHVATNIAARIGQILAVGFVIAGFYMNPFLVFIGVFIFLGAKAEAEATQSRSMLKGYTVKDALMRDFQSIESSETIQKAVDVLLNGQAKSFLITQNQKPVGTLSRDEIIQALSKDGKETIISQVMNSQLIVVEANTPLENLYQQLIQHKTGLILVVESTMPIGTIDLENIAEFILVKSAMAQAD